MVKNPSDGKSKHKNIVDYSCYIHVVGVIFYQNEDGDVTDIQADIIGPGKSFLGYVILEEQVWK